MAWVARALLIFDHLTARSRVKWLWRFHTVRPLLFGFASKVYFAASAFILSWRSSNSQLLLRALSIFIACFFAGCSANPTPETVSKIEKSAERTYRDRNCHLVGIPACGIQMKDYDRCYAPAGAFGLGVIKGVYFATAIDAEMGRASGREFGGVKIVSSVAELPNDDIEDGGCDVISISWSVLAQQLTEFGCNGVP